MDTRFLGLATEDWHAIAFSAGVSSVAVLVSLPFGLVLGWLLARRTFLGKTLLETLLNLPLVLPPVVTGYLLLLLLGRRGWLAALLRRLRHRGGLHLDGGGAGGRGDGVSSAGAPCAWPFRASIRGSLRRPVRWARDRWTPS